MTEPWFIVRAWPSDVSETPVESRTLTLEVAIEEARKLAWDAKLHYRQVMVTDDNGMAWAIFNMLWSAMLEE